ncbi:MAG: type I-E CRISPR-associated protein Cas6/Cse3/CasE [Acidobacteriia bacterium]|nr:type I-E CRISPR-associated protein Cas6/Cse3/CasE [Terriglobia bacterium]MYG01398.1 type I-E CRISPR-associated protein Cas6/Cse3/CasE [Terriglobia bacterium]MYK09559.1 type I-E CRISPR-associated protein Cas6/Cse3/CasE [Terriglobia bacterium]
MTLYLSRLSLNRAAPAAALMPLLNPDAAELATDAHHRLMWSVFSDGKEHARDFLWRHIGQGRFLALSRRPPHANDLFNAPETKAFSPVLRVGDRLHFTLRANATKDRATVSRLDKTARRGKSRRVDVVMDLMRTAHAGEKRSEIRERTAQAAAEAWMERQGAAKGFAPQFTLVEDYSVIELGRRRRQGATFGILDLQGEIEVVDPGVFLAALATGFGRAKAWGCGLMLIRRAK